MVMTITMLQGIMSIVVVVVGGVSIGILLLPLLKTMITWNRKHPKNLMTFFVNNNRGRIRRRQRTRNWNTTKVVRRGGGRVTENHHLVVVAVTIGTEIKVAIVAEKEVAIVTEIGALIVTEIRVSIVTEIGVLIVSEIGVSIVTETKVAIVTEIGVSIVTETEVMIVTETARKRRRRKTASIVHREETATDTNAKNERSEMIMVIVRKGKNVTKEVNAEYDENENQVSEVTGKIEGKELKNLRERSATMAKNVSEGDPLDGRAK
jgi:hypothetical protein